MLYQKIQSLFNPERYHGWGKSKRYFEGWYYKVITADEKHAMAFIPGIAMDNSGKKQAFVQVLDGKKLTASYHKFPANKFSSKSDSFATSIESNHFEIDMIELNLDNVKGKLRFDGQVPWPNQWYSPGIMGPFAFVPFMECYHGILSMDHSIEGCLEVGAEKIDFSGGRGYIEKDWGHSFPSAYVWMQTNHFSHPGISLKASVAKIPWMGSSFVGFIAGLYFENKLIQFTTYNQSDLLKSHIDSEKILIILQNRNYRLEIDVQRSDATELASPILGFMDGRISESMTSNVKTRLLNTKNGNVLFEDTGRNTGLEVAGYIPDILIG